MAIGIKEKSETKQASWLHRHWNRLCVGLGILYLTGVIFFPGYTFQLSTTGIYVALLLILYLFITDQEPWFRKLKKGEMGWWTGKNFWPQLRFALLVILVICIIMFCKSAAVRFFR